ncbi:hypothetical protein M2459_003330, partial [Parabacteroides sp. PF5-5]|nr:hypothetical protein [Parabacteroides sp. PH5-39]MDH6314286.1 hypothetical protein [Parabacteroides sp. PF5-13]MDH6318328.1 hypothetical protein [Parabacteroides sp. PH5-13]MDH6322058.1 hypothetical protein [Parabacteroides sp. PH5-8]MDH6325863.1 hypothetical protein [Parabacteroides sp. PH5-41]MDH6333275.1 hypothetical protein [Parabacteroides sp. PF5-5]MDH6344728.1 hypothetical protein [Parabacteroides sp. PH5-46]MDH6359296.1 hypothetical protein [Parabacteroides sp. PH5-16]MDH6374961.
NKYKQKIAYIILRIQTILLSEKLKAAF